MKHRAVEEPVADPTDAVRQARESHAVLRYTTLRLAIFLVALALLWLVRVRGLLLVALALLISGLASYALLQRQRDLMSVQWAAASARRRARAAARAAREDAVADELAVESVEEGRRLEGSQVDRTRHVEDLLPRDAPDEPGE